MRPCRLVCLLVLVGLALPLHAQEPRPAESASHEMIVAALQGQEILFLRQQENYNFMLKDHQVTLSRLDNGGRVSIKALAKKKFSLEVLNRYNEDAAVTTRAVRHQKAGVMLEAGLDCQLGVTAASLQKFVRRFSDELTKFENFLGKQVEQAVKDEPIGGKRKVPLKATPGSDDKEFIINFPTNVPPEKADTAWKIVWDIETVKQALDQQFKFPPKRDQKSGVLFKIKKAYYKPGPNAPWIQVLDDAHPSEFYVPYYFRDTRFFDLRDVGFYTPLSAREGGAVSQPLSATRRVMAELRDTGPAFKHGNITRRGEELTLWANFHAANYTYMIEYGFRDDGTIVFRHAPTGYNYYHQFDAYHMHGSYWRVGVKLGPEGNNEINNVYAVRLPTDPKLQGNKGILDVKEITQESFLDWNPREFTRIRITNPNVSFVAEGKEKVPYPIAYDLVTQQQGIARHNRFQGERFTMHDFWITRHDCPEKMYINLGEHFYTPTGAPNPKLQPLNNQNVVLWHSSSALHVPRGEDGIISGNSVNNGQALIYWTTFELRPRNLFPKTPIYRRSE